MLQHTFVKAAQQGCEQALQLAYRRWSRRAVPNPHLLELTVVVATRHACVQGRLGALRWLHTELRGFVADHGMRDNWDFCCYSGNTAVARQWMEWHGLGREALENRHYYPLIAAALRGSIATVRVIIEHCELAPADLVGPLRMFLRRMLRRGLTHMVSFFLDVCHAQNVDFMPRSVSAGSGGCVCHDVHCSVWTVCPRCVQVYTFCCLFGRVACYHAVTLSLGGRGKGIGKTTGCT